MFSHAAFFSCRSWIGLAIEEEGGGRGRREEVLERGYVRAFIAVCDGSFVLSTRLLMDVVQCSVPLFSVFLPCLCHLQEKDFYSPKSFLTLRNTLSLSGS